MTESAEEEKSRPRSVKEWLRLALCGMAMGAADLVPGVSGGTMAFITGIYPSLIKSITSFDMQAVRCLLQLRMGAFFQQVAWEFLLALLFGMVLAIGTLTPVIQDLLHDPVGRTLLFATFLGLILGSVWFCAKQVPQWGVYHYLALLLAATAAFFLSGTKPPSPKQSTNEAVYDVAIDASQISLGSQPALVSNYDLQKQRLLTVPSSTLAAMLAKEEINPETQAYDPASGRQGPVTAFVQASHGSLFSVWLFISGAIAICAMLLPGVSGSYLLTILGSYTVFISALGDFIHGLKQLHFDVYAFFSLGSFGCGILLGVVVFSRMIQYLLEHYHTITIAALTGFMVGALRAVWPFYTYSFALNPLRLQHGPQLLVVDPVLPDPLALLTYAALSLAVLGFLVVFTLERVAGRKV